MSQPQPGSDPDLADTFAAQRPRLRSIAHRMLGSQWDADDAVQETWVRLQRTKTDEIVNLEAWLTAVISRASIDQLRTKGARHEDVDADTPDAEPGNAIREPEASALQADDVGTAMLIVLDTLNPLERLALLLHDVFGLSFDDIAPIVERTPATARQLASRARRRIRDVNIPAERSRQREAVSAFLKASREGDFGTLLQLLDPDVELRADADAVSTTALGADHGAPLLQPYVHGADAVARVFGGRARGTQIAIINGLPGATFAPDGEPWAIYTIHLHDDRITRIEAIADARQLADLTIILE